MVVSSSSAQLNSRLSKASLEQSETILSTEKKQTCFILPFFDVKTPPGSDQTATTAASSHQCFKQLVASSP